MVDRGVVRLHEAKNTETETVDEITVETKVTEVKTVRMSMTHKGDVSVEETTEVLTDTGLKETRKTTKTEETTTNRSTEVYRPITSTTTRSNSSYAASEASVDDSGSMLAIEAVGGNTTDGDSVMEIDKNSVVSHDDTMRSDDVFEHDVDNEDDDAYEAMDIMRAVCAYEPENDDALSLHEGESVELINSSDESWWRIRKLFDSRQGNVPAAYLKSKKEYEKLVEEVLNNHIEKMSADTSE